MSKGQDQQQDQKNIDTVLSSEANSLTKMRNVIGELLEANKQLENSIQLKREVDELKKAAPSLPWFKRLVQIIPQVKYLFIKNDEQIAAEKREFNKEILTYVDNTLTKVGKKSSSLQVIIDKELQVGLDKILHNKSLLPEQLAKVGELQEYLNSLDVSPKDSREIVSKVYNANEVVALINERTQLTKIQQDITDLVSANSKVQGLLAIKKELAELQQELPSTWLDNLKKSVAKIKDAFVKNPEQILKDTVVKNNLTLRYVDNALKTTGNIIESSKLARKNKLHKELEKLEKRGVSRDQLDLLSSKIDSTFAKTIAISGPLFTMDQQQSQSQPLYSSMSNLQTTSSLRPAPPPPLASTSLPNPAVNQPNIAATIPQPLPGQSAQQAAVYIPPRPTRPAPPPPPLTRTVSSPDINAPKTEENVRRASTSSRKKYQAPLPPTQATSLHNLATQQPNVESAVIPPAPPPPPPHVVPGLQQGVHQVEGQVVPPPLAAEFRIPTPPPLAAAGGFPPPPPPPPPSAEQPKNPVEGQENRGQLLHEIVTGVPLKKVEVVEKPPTRDDMLAAIKAGRDGKFNLRKVPEINKDGGTGEVKPKAETSDMGSILKQALAERNKAMHGNDDDDDEHEHADLVEFIKNTEVNESSLISKLHTDFPESQNIKSKQTLIKFIKQDLTGDWDDGELDKQDKIIEKLETIKEKYERNTLDLSAKPVVEAPTGNTPANVVAEAQAIGQALQKPENVAGQTSKPPPAPPLPLKNRPAGQGK